MEIRLLGSVQLVASHDGPVQLARRQRALLAALAVEPGHVVGADRLVDVAWGDDLPADPANALQGRISQLRKAFDGGGISREGNGYRLCIAPEAVDAVRFTDLADRGRTALTDGAPTTAEQHLAAGLQLWRGRPLDEVADQAWAAAEAARLEERRLGALEDLVDARLAQGKERQLLAELEGHVAQHPLRERLRGQLMLALYRAGQQAAALETYRRCCEVLRDELGTDPGSALSELHQRILQRDPALAAPRPTEPPPASTPVTPIIGEAWSAPPAVVGREVAFGSVAAGWQRAVSGRGELLFVTGDAGIGKSLLVSSLTKRVLETGASAVVGRCSETAGAPAFWPWVQVLRGILDEVADDDLAALLGPQAPILATLVPELGERWPDLPTPRLGDAATARFQLHDAIGRVLQRLGRDAPRLVVIEDAHVADDPTIELLGLLPTYLEDTGVLVVVSLRDREANAKLTDVLADLAGHPGVERLELQGLARDEVARLVTTLTQLPPSEELVTAVHDRTGGNPLFVREMLRLLSATTSDPQQAIDAAQAEIPPTVADVITRRVRLLPEATVAVLEAAAILGRDPTTAAIAGLSGLTRAEVLDRLEPAANAGLITAAGPHTAEHRFVHVLVRDTIEATLSPRRRASLHDRAARAFAARSDPAGTYAVAHHRLHSLPVGELREAVAATIAAAEHARRSLALEHGDQLLERAVEAIHRFGPDEQLERDVLARRALLIVEADGFSSQRIPAVVARARTLGARVGDTPDMLGALYALWAFEMNQARYRQALELADEVLWDAELSDDPAASCQGLFTRGAASFQLGRVREGVDSLRRARQLADTLPDEEARRRGIGHLLLDCSVAVPHAFWLVDEGQDNAAQLRATVERLDADQAHYARTHARMWWCFLPAVSRDVPACRRIAEEAVTLAEQHDLDYLRAMSAIFRGWATAVSRDPTAGVAEMEDAITTLERFGSFMFRTVHLDLLAQGLEAADRLRDAEETLERAFEVVERTGEADHLAELQRRRAEQRRAAGAADDALRWALRAVDTAQEQQVPALLRRANDTLDRLRNGCGPLGA